MWQDAIDTWIAGRRSPQTRRSYALAIDRWQTYVAAHHVTLATAGASHVASWIATLHGVVAVNSIRQRLSAISAFYDWQAKHMQPPIRSDNPTRAVAWPQRQEPRRRASDRAIDAEKATALIDQADVRGRALIALMCVEALRCAEACGLRWNDYDGRMLVVEGKGGKRRFVQIADVTADVLEEWRQESVADTNGYIFPGRSSVGHLSTDAAYEMVRGLGRALGVDISAASASSDGDHADAERWRTTARGAAGSRTRQPRDDRTLHQESTADRFE